MSTLGERVARLEEGKEHQDKAIDRLTSRVDKLIIILVILGASAGIDRALSVVGLIP